MSCSINLYRFNSNNKIKPNNRHDTITCHAQQSSDAKQSSALITTINCFVFATIVLCDDIKHSVASPTMATTPNNCLQRQVGIIPTPTTDFVGATKSMRFCNDDAFIHTAPDRGFKPNVMHCFTQAQPSTTPCVGYLFRQTTASRHTVTC
jgi:hypothetical protein